MALRDLLRSLLAPMLAAGLAAGGALAPAQPARAQGEVCEAGPAYQGPVSLVILASGAKVRQLAASVKDARVLRRDAETVVFDDGRVITADVAAAGDHLNALGWGSRRIDVAVTLPKRRARPRSAYG